MKGRFIVISGKRQYEVRLVGDLDNVVKVNTSTTEDACLQGAALLGHRGPNGRKGKTTLSTHDPRIWEVRAPVKGGTGLVGIFIAEEVAA